MIMQDGLIPFIRFDPFYIWFVKELWSNFINLFND